MKKILVTGGAGFIGSHLVNFLISKKKEVIIIDSLSLNSKMYFINPKAKFIKMNIININKSKSKFLKNIDIIFHLAAQSSGEPAYDNPKKDLITNGIGTFNVAKFAIKNNIKKVIYLSSVAVYGNTNEKKINENSHKNPDSLYGVSKLTGEFYIKQTLKNTKTKYTIFRLVSTFGPGEDLNNLKKGIISIYSNFLWRDKPVIVKGSQERIRDLIYIDDVIAILYETISNKKSNNNIYNLSYSKKYKVKNILKTLLKIFGKETNYIIKQFPPTPGDSFNLSTSNIKLLNDFKYKPKFDLKKGLKTYVYWIKKIPINANLLNYHPFKK